jgi:hypothetical protein
MLTKVIFLLICLKAGVVEMFSWRYSFEKINSEYRTVVKKREALNSLFNSGKISKSTFELFDREFEEALAEVERQKRVLLEKMAAKIGEVEEQIKILERLLANYEIQHVSGEVDDETYQREVAVLSIGLENARLELNAIKEAMDKLGGVGGAETVKEHVAEAETVGGLNVGEAETPKAEPKMETGAAGYT